MGAYESVISIANELSFVNQVEAIAIQQASIDLGFCPKILHQTCSSTKGGPCHVSLIHARQKYHHQQIAFHNKGRTQKKKEVFSVNEEKMKMTINQSKAINHLSSHDTNDTSSRDVYATVVSRCMEIAKHDKETK
eukprot:14674956-Ditylum_brightwellii.AAC.1